MLRLRLADGPAAGRARPGRPGRGGAGAGRRAAGAGAYGGGAVLTLRGRLLADAVVRDLLP